MRYILTVCLFVFSTSVYAQQKPVDFTLPPMPNTPDDVDELYTLRDYVRTNFRKLMAAEAAFLSDVEVFKSDCVGPSGLIKSENGLCKTQAGALLKREHHLVAVRKALLELKERFFRELREHRPRVDVLRSQLDADLQDHSREQSSLNKAVEVYNADCANKPKNPPCQKRNKLLNQRHAKLEAEDRRLVEKEAQFDAALRKPRRSN